MVEPERLYEALGQHRDRVEIMRRRLQMAPDAESPPGGTLPHGRHPRA